MLISPRQFPHPVLSYFADDLVDCDYQSTVKITTANTSFNFKVISVTSSPDLRKLLESGKASHAIHIDCPTTRYRKLFTSNGKKFSFHIESQQLEGRVQVSRFIVADTDILNYTNKNFHADYDGISFKINKGDILALNETFIFDAEKEIDPLKSIPSIFSVRLNKEEDPPAINIDLSKKINIYLSEKNYRKFKTLNQITSVRPIIAQLILIPALTSILEMLKVAGDDEMVEYEDLRWFKILSKRLKDYGVDLDIGSWPESETSLMLSQKLIGEPITSSLEALEIMLSEA